MICWKVSMVGTDGRANRLFYEPPDARRPARQLRPSFLPDTPHHIPGNVAEPALPGRQYCARSDRGTFGDATRSARSLGVCSGTPRTRLCRAAGVAPGEGVGVATRSARSLGENLVLPEDALQLL